MKNQIKRLLVALVLLSTLGLDLPTARGQGTAFTYQGQLTAGGSPASGNYDFTFALYNNSGTNTGQVGSTLTNLGVGVTNGIFSVLLDFGASFPGASRWLAIGVRTNGAANFTPLNPLQELTPTPYAIYAPSAGAAASANSVSATNISGVIPLAQLPAAVVTNNAIGVVLSGTLNNALSFPGSFSNSLVLWFDADQINQSNGTVVTTWPDMSGNQRNATNSNVSSGVTFYTNAINGMPGVLFNGGNNCLTTPFFLGSMTNVMYTNYSVFYVYQNTDPSLTAVHIIWSATNNIGVACDGPSTYNFYGLGFPFCANVAPRIESLVQYYLFYNGTPYQQYYERQDGLGCFYTGYGAGYAPLVGAISIGGVWQSPNNSFGWAFSGYICEYILLDHTASQSEINAIETYLVNKYNIGNTARLIFAGDSLTAGYIGGTSPGISTNNYPSVVYASLGSNYGFDGVNNGWIGQTAADFAPLIPSFYDNAKRTSRDVVLFWMGANDIVPASGETVTQAYDAIVSCCAQVRALGYPVLVGTVICREDVNVESSRTNLNNLIRSKWPSFANGLMDFGGDPILGNTNSCTNAAYYQSDEVHLSSLGYGIVGGIATTALSTYLSNANGANLTNLNASALAGGTIPLAVENPAVVTNNYAGTVTIDNNLTVATNITAASITGGALQVGTINGNPIFTGLPAFANGLSVNVQANGFGEPVFWKLAGGNGFEMYTAGKGTGMASSFNLLGYDSNSEVNIGQGSASGGPITELSNFTVYASNINLNGVINGNGAGLTNVQGSNIAGPLLLAALPSAVVTNNENGVSLGGAFSGSGLGLSVNATNIAGILPASNLPTGLGSVTQQTAQRAVGGFVAGLQNSGQWTNLVEAAWFSPGQNYVSPGESNGTCNVIGIVQQSDSTNPPNQNAGLAVNCVQTNTGLYFNGTNSLLTFSNLPAISAPVTIMVFYTGVQSMMSNGSAIIGLYNSNNYATACMRWGVGEAGAGASMDCGGVGAGAAVFTPGGGTPGLDGYPHCVVMSTDGTNLSLYGTCSTLSWSNASVVLSNMSNWSVSTLEIGMANQNGVLLAPFCGVVHGFAVWSNYMTLAQAAQIYLLAANTVLPWRRVVFEGDSLANNLAQSACISTNSNFQFNCTYISTAVPGTSIEAIVNRFYSATFTNLPNGIDLIYPSTVLFWGGQNSLGTDTAAQIEAGIQWEVSAVHACGSRIYISTPTESQSVTTNSEASRLALKAWELSGASGADGVVDNDSMFFNLLGTNYYTNLTYFQTGGVHPNGLGNSLVASNFNAVVGTNILTPNDYFVGYPSQTLFHN